MENNAQEESVKERIIGLLQKGYNRSQLINDLEFAERTVDAAIKKYKEMGNDNGDGDKSVSTSGRDSALAIRREKESVLPEWLESDVANIFDGNLRDRKIFMAGMSVPLMGLRLFAESANPIVGLLTVWQEGQARAAQASQGAGIEMANAAGQAAASGVVKFFTETKPWLAAAPDPWKAMLMDSMRPAFSQVIGQLMGGLLRSNAQSQAGMQPATGDQMASPAFQKPNNVNQATDAEIKEAFNDE